MISEDENQCDQEINPGDQQQNNPAFPVHVNAGLEEKDIPDKKVPDNQNFKNTDRNGADSIEAPLPVRPDTEDLQEVEDKKISDDVMEQSIKGFGQKILLIWNALRNSRIYRHDDRDNAAHKGIDGERGKAREMLRAVSTAPSDIPRHKTQIKTPLSFKPRLNETMNPHLNYD